MGRPASPYSRRRRSRRNLEKVFKLYIAVLSFLIVEFRWLDEEYPQSDDVNEYVRSHPLHIPFRDILFGDGITGADAPVQGSRRGNSVLNEQMRTVKTTNHAKYTGIVK
jgi:hypothetical protein